MREIKFRAWLPGLKKMTHTHTLDDLVNWGLKDDRNCETAIWEQYTGLRDKNGVEIYEGDVVGAFCDTQRFEIKYCEKRGGYFLDGVVLCGGAEPAPECLGNLFDTVEVIGNIHEHPHLLEGGEPRG